MFQTRSWHYLEASRLAAASVAAAEADEDAAADALLLRAWVHSNLAAVPAEVEAEARSTDQG